jgi:hypothetical protein
MSISMIRATALSAFMDRCQAIGLAKTTPEVFWTIFGTPNSKRAAERLLDSALEKLNAIKMGMPE